MSAAGGTQTVLITGATDGLGKAAALLLAERGYRVFAAGRSADKRAQLDALAKEKHLPLETIHVLLLISQDLERLSSQLQLLLSQELKAQSSSSRQRERRNSRGPKS